MRLDHLLSREHCQGMAVLVLCFLVLGCAWALDISCCFGGGAVGFWAYGPGWLHCHGCFGCVVWFGWLVVICIVVRVSVMQVFLSCFSLFFWWNRVWFVVFLGVRWMPWYQGPMKGVVDCDIPRGVVERALIRGCLNGGTRLVLWPVTVF